MTGTVVTFYSYKGGVGRSFALANIAVLLGRWGFRVLCIDWDLEAPGLAHFFDSVHQKPYNKPQRLDERSGLLDLLLEFKKRKQTPLEWRPFVQIVEPDRAPGVSLMVAGRHDDGYSRRLQTISWPGLYRLGLGNALETMVDEFRSEYDFIFIDSRTGVTDFSGIITAQLPDILVFLFTANIQSIEGSTSVARRAAAVRDSLAIDRPRLLLLPIPARFETQLEHKISLQWRERFSKELAEFYSSWAAKDVPLDRITQATTIPYVPFWSFGERLSVLEDDSRDPLSINYSLETIAALIAHRLGQTRLLFDSRDEFVGSAKRLSAAGRTTKRKIFLSYLQSNQLEARQLAHGLERRGFEIFHNVVRSAPDADAPSLNDEIRSRIQQSGHMVALLGKESGSSRSQIYEIRTFLRQAASDEQPRILVPVVSRYASFGDVPDFLRQYQLVTIGGSPEAKVGQIARLLDSRHSESPSPATELQVYLQAGNGEAVSGVSVTALARNNTTVDALSDENGVATLELREGRSYRLLIAHPKFSAVIITDFRAGEPLEVEMPYADWTGSAVIHSKGSLPGLQGQLNLGRDSRGRAQLYADGLIINGSRKQPVYLEVGEPIALEDPLGTRLSVVAKLISGRTSLLEFSRRSPGQDHRRNLS